MFKLVEQIDKLHKELNKKYNARIYFSLADRKNEVVIYDFKQLIEIAESKDRVIYYKYRPDLSHASYKLWTYVNEIKYECISTKEEYEEFKKAVQDRTTKVVSL